MQKRTDAIFEKILIYSFINVESPIADTRRVYSTLTRKNIVAIAYETIKLIPVGLALCQVSID